MKRFFVLAALVLALVPPASSGPPVPGRDPKKLQVLILTGYNMHDWRKITESLRSTLEATGRFEVRVNEEPAGCDEKTFEGYDAIVLNFTNHMKVFGPEWPESTRKALMGVLERGKGVVAFHAALSSHVEWPEYEKMIGGAWRAGATHAPYHEFQVDLKESEHPILKGLPASFIQNDEVNQRLTMQPGITVLATAYDDPKNCSKGEVKICGSGKDEPIMWVQPYRNGRVFTTALGHDLKSVSSPGFIATFQRGVEWAATGAVTIPPPAELKAGR